MVAMYGRGAKRITKVTRGGKTEVVGRQKQDLFLNERSQPPLIAANDDDWNAVCLNPNCEARAERGLAGLGIVSYRPTYTKWAKHPYGRQEVERNLMPPYMFIKFGERGPNWEGIRNTDGIRSIVKSDKGIPISIPAALIAKIAEQQVSGTWDEVKRKVSKSGKVSLMPEVTFGAGQPVEVSYGPWHGCAEVIEQITDGSVRVLMEMLGAKRPVTVPAEGLIAITA